MRFRCVAILGLILLLAAACQPQHASVEPATSEIQIRGAQVQLEIADTPAAQRRGLGYRDSLAWNHGMLFTYARPRVVGIWMKGMRFDIDIVWLRDGRIVDMHWRAPHEPQDALPSYVPREIADMVLEVPAGYAEAHGWRVGDEANLKIQAADAPKEEPPGGS